MKLSMEVIFMVSYIWTSGAGWSIRTRQTRGPIDAEGDAVGNGQGEHEYDQAAQQSLRNADLVQVTSDEIARHEKCDRRNHEAEHARIVPGVSRSAATPLRLAEADGKVHSDARIQGGFHEDEKGFVLGRRGVRRRRASGRLPEHPGHRERRRERHR